LNALHEKVENIEKKGHLDELLDWCFLSD
jgi:hypothetical protein